MKIWKDTIRVAFCSGPTCRRRIHWAQNVATGRQMCFDGPPIVIVTETEIGTNREMQTISLDNNHWATCPDRAQFKKKRPARSSTPTMSRRR